MLQRQEYEKAVAAAEQYQQWPPISQAVPASQPVPASHADDIDDEDFIPTDIEEEDEEKDEENEDDDAPKSRGKRKAKPKGKRKVSQGKFI